MTKRLSLLRELLMKGTLATQEGLREKLEKMKFQVTQSTISRDLRKLGAVRTVDGEGRTVYRLSEVEPVNSNVVKYMIKSVKANASLVVIHTAPSTASLVARHLDMHCGPAILGTIAGDDTVFVALAPKRNSHEVMGLIEATLSTLG